MRKDALFVKSITPLKRLFKILIHNDQIKLCFLNPELEKLKPPKVPFAFELGQTIRIHQGDRPKEPPPNEDQERIEQVWIRIRYLKVIIIWKDHIILVVFNLYSAYRIGDLLL